MKAKAIYDVLDEIRTMAEQYTDDNGNIEVDEIRVRVALQFCSGELQKAFEKGKAEKGKAKLPD